MERNSNVGAIRTLFLDIGGVLLTNGWEHESRMMAAEKFGLDKDELEERHKLVFNAYEIGDMTLDEYLDWTVFCRPRKFSGDLFKAFMYEQSQVLEGHIEFFKALKQEYKLKVVAVSNEGKELNEHRIRQFGLDELFDAYISSCYVHLYKPDPAMLQLACDVSHTDVAAALYVDDRRLLVEAAKNFGLLSLQFQTLDKAKEFMQTCTFYNKSNK